MEPLPMKQELDRILKLFRELYGSLPIAELSNNPELTKKIELFESQIKKLNRIVCNEYIEVN